MMVAEKEKVDVYGRFATATSDFITEFLDWPAMRPWWKRLGYLGLIALVAIWAIGIYNGSWLGWLLEGRR